MPRDYQILGIIGQEVRACAQFFYKGKLISFSTIFQNPSKVMVFSKDSELDREFDSVEQAIAYIDSLPV